MQPTRIATRRSAPTTEVDVRLSLLSSLDQLPAELVESLRYLLARLEGDNTTPIPARLAFTSALHGEGVTTVSRSLAAVLTNDYDRMVCWLGLGQRPLPRRGAPRPESSARGLFDVVAGRASIDEVLTATSDPRMMHIGGGAFGSSERQILARGPQFMDVIDQLAGRFDHLVFDLPPLLTGSEGLALLRAADAYALVVRHGVTSIPQVKAAATEARGTRSLGVVLNRFSSKIPKRWSHLFLS